MSQQASSEPSAAVDEVKTGAVVELGTVAETASVSVPNDVKNIPIGEALGGLGSKQSKPPPTKKDVSETEGHQPSNINKTTDDASSTVADSSSHEKSGPSGAAAVPAALHGLAAVAAAADSDTSDTDSNSSRTDTSTSEQVGAGDPRAEKVAVHSPAAPAAAEHQPDIPDSPMIDGAGVATPIAGKPLPEEMLAPSTPPSSARCASPAFAPPPLPPPGGAPPPSHGDSQLPDRKKLRRNLNNPKTHAGKAIVVVDPAGVWPVAGGFRKAACTAAGLCYKIFRSSNHSQTCPGWKAFVMGPLVYECPSCHLLNHNVDEELLKVGIAPAALCFPADGDSRDLDDASIPVAAQRGAPSSIQGPAAVDTLVLAGGSNQRTPQKRKSLKCDVEDDNTPCKHRRNQLNPSAEEFVTQHPQHQLKAAPCDGSRKVPYFCGLCQRIVEALKSGNAKYLIQHCDGQRHKANLAPVAGSHILPNSPGLKCAGYTMREGMAKTHLASVFAKSLRRWRLFGGRLESLEGPTGNAKMLLLVSTDELLLQEEPCRDAGGNLALPFGSLCSECLHLANSKQLTMCACRFSLLLDMIDLLDVRLHDPEASFRQFTDTAQTADYCRRATAEGGAGQLDVSECT